MDGRLQAEQVAGSVVQALVFAELHRRNGLPPGRQGFAMLFVWSMALGFLRLRTGRLRAERPWLEASKSGAAS